MGPLPIVLGVVVAGIAGYILTRKNSAPTPSRGVLPSAKVKTVASRNFPFVKGIAEKWGKRFSVPVPFILTIAQIESGYNPALFNTNARAMKLGGAWGVTAMTLNTAKGLVPKLQPLAAQEPLIKLALDKWNGTGQSLLDPDLCLLLSVFMMSGLWIKYKGDYRKVAAAYHSGGKPVDEAIKAGVDVTAKLGTFGKDYVARAEKIFPTLSGVA